MLCGVLRWGEGKTRWQAGAGSGAWQAAGVLSVIVLSGTLLTLLQRLAAPSSVICCMKCFSARDAGFLMKLEGDTCSLSKT